MMNMRKTVFARAFVVLLALALVFTCSGISAAALDKNKNYKGSLSEYVGKSYLKSESKQLFSFDTAPSGNTSSGTVDTKNKKEGTGSYSYTFSTDSSTSITKLLNAPNFFEATDCTPRGTVTLRMWVYVNDMNLLVNDHLDVHPDYQDEYDDYTTSGTLYVRIINSNGSEATVNHTIYGSGWQECEFSFNLNDNGGELMESNAASITGMWIGAKGSKGLTVKLDDLRVVRFTNEGYTEPEAPNGGRWLATCDFDVLDGTCINEWYGGFFDLEEKVGGSSSVGLNVRRIDDFRLYWPKRNVTLDLDKDLLFIWYKIDNFKELSQIEFNLHKKGSYETTAIGLRKLDFMTNVVDPETLERIAYKPNEWNLAMIPLSGYKSVNGGMNLFNVGTMRVAVFGTCNKVNFNMYFDDIYVVDKANLGMGTTQNSDTAIPSDDASEISSEPTSENAPSITGIIIGAVALAVIIAVAVIVIIKKSKKKKAVADVKEESEVQPDENE